MRFRHHKQHRTDDNFWSHDVIGTAHRDLRRSGDAPSRPWPTDQCGRRGDPCRRSRLSERVRASRSRSRQFAVPARWERLVLRHGAGLPEERRVVVGVPHEWTRDRLRARQRPTTRARGRVRRARSTNPLTSRGSPPTAQSGSANGTASRRRAGARFPSLPRRGPWLRRPEGRAETAIVGPPGRNLGMSRWPSRPRRRERRTTVTATARRRSLQERPDAADR